MNLDTREPLPVRRDLARPALNAFFSICEKWDLTSEEARILLGSPARSTYYRWKRDRTGALTHDVLERISYILGIYKALHILFGASAQADGWIKRDNSAPLFGASAQADGWIKRDNSAPLFGGHSALERMVGGQVADLYVVRQYLDSQRGWG